MQTRMIAWTIAAGFAVGMACEDERTGLVDSGQDSGWQDSGPPDSGPFDSGAPDASCVPPTAFGCFFQPGQEVWVDGFGGADDAGACCCGTTSLPCQTLTYTMATIADGGTVDIQIHAYLSDGGAVWHAPEAWPIHLGLGVTLTAPDVWFSPSPSGSFVGLDVFGVYPYSPTDGSRVTIQGDPLDAGHFIVIGLPLDAGTSSHSTVLSAVGDPPFASVFSGLPLQLSNVWLQGDTYTFVAGYEAIVTLGPLPVHLGSLLGAYPVHEAEEGIDCYFATIQDIGSQVLQIDSQGFDIYAHYGCSILLSHGPSLGLKPDAIGFGTCAAKRDGTAIGAVANSTVTVGSLLEPAELHCFSEAALSLSNGDTGVIPPLSSPSVTLFGNESNSDCFGAAIAGGSLTAISSTFKFNRAGLWAFNSGVLLLDSFTSFMLNNPTQVLCNTVAENPLAPCLYDTFAARPYNANVAITNGATVAAVDLNDVAWTHWDADAGAPQVWTCYDDAYQSCACTGPGCLDAGLQAINETTQADVIYQGGASDAGPFVFGSGFGGSCP
jgi:hypothetical protein